MQDEISRHHARARGAQRCLQRVAIHRGIGIEVHRAFARRDLADRAHVLSWVHTRELLVGGERQLAVELFHMMAAARNLFAQVLEEPARAFLHAIDNAVMRDAAGAGITGKEYLFKRLHNGGGIAARRQRHAVEVMNLRRHFIIRSGDALHDCRQPVLPRRYGVLVRHQLVAPSTPLEASVMLR